MSWAHRTREFFSALFGSKLVVELRREVAELEVIRRRAEDTRDAELQRARNEVATPLRQRNAELAQERDYFRGRVERLEMRIEELLHPPPVVIPPREHKNLKPTGRKLWNQVQSEHREKIRASLKAEAEAKDKQPKTPAAPEAIH